MGERRPLCALHKAALTAGLALLSACVAPTSNLPTVNPLAVQAEAEKQLVVAIRERDRHGQRLAQIGVPILAANVDQCGANIRNRAGVQFHSALLNTSMVNRRATVAARGLSRAGEVRVAYTLPGMPADGVLLPGDVVTRINGSNAYAVASGQARVNYQLPTLRVRVLRNGQQLDFRIPTVPVCSYRVILTSNEEVGAFAGRNTIIFTTGIMRLMDADRDIALVFGHEMAHLTRNHQAAKQANAAIGALIAAVVSGAIGVDVVDIGAKIGARAYSQEFESEADYVGMYHASRAGWNMAGAGNTFRQMALANPEAIHSLGGTHPSFASRAVLVEQTALEIESKRARNLALVPNYKGQPESNIPLSAQALAVRQPPSATGPASAANAPRAAVAPRTPNTATVVTPAVTGVSTARREDAEQLFQRAVAFEKGTGRPQDIEEAVKWYRKAAAQGHRDAMFNLGMMYTQGRGVRQNNGEAVIYFRQAAELKHPRAHYNLGFMQENGRGVAKSPAKGLTNYIIAANLGVGGDANSAIERLRQTLPSKQIDEAQHRADSWMKEHRR